MGKLLVTAGILAVGYATGILQLMFMLTATLFIWLASVPAIW